MEKKLISVIVPVFCAENYLERCVKSILNQTYPHWELLLVDDGSPDASPELCDNWALMDKRIRCYHKKNGGVSSARNMGLDNIKGDFITFLDSDDCLEPTCFEECLNRIIEKNLDVLQFRMKRLLLDGTVRFKESVSSQICDTETYVKMGYPSGCVCGGLYKSSIFTENNIRFNENLHYLEDAFVVCEILKHSKSNQLWDKPFYLYYFNPNGSDKPKKWDFYLDPIEFAATYKKENPLFAKLIDGWCTMLAMLYVARADKYSYERFSKAWKALSLSKEYLRDAHRKDVVFFNTMYHLFGIKAACKLTRELSKMYYFVSNKN